MKSKFLISLFLINLAAFSQFSKTHYLPPLSGSSKDGSVVEEQYLYISTPSTTPVNFKIIQLGDATIFGTVSRDIPYTYTIGFGQNTQFHVDRGSVNTVLSNKGYIIEAEDVVYVTARVIAGNGNQAGALVSKGIAALGKEFRIGSLLNTASGSYTNGSYTFISILATENNTTVVFNDIRAGAVLINNGTASNTHADVLLNSGQSYVIAVEGPTNANRDALIGALVTSNKPIAVNCGSFAGTNGATNLDLGFDQIVPSERTGKEYIFIKSTGQNIVERVILVANKDNTEVFLNGSTSPDYVLNKSDYIAIDGSKYSTNGNMYVRTTESVFAYQTVGDNSRTDLANQELFFVPPLNCETPKVVDNIPFIEQIGNRNFTGRVTILTKTGSPLLFRINEINYTRASLPSGIAVDGPKSVTGNAAYETYTITGLTGNVSVISTTELYVAAYGSDGAAAFGGFYSGFSFKPEIIQEVNAVGQLNCLPNAKLKVSGASSFDVFQWYFNNVAIQDAVNNEYNPTSPGYYYVKATISACGTSLNSDKIPVSNCPTDGDKDLANDNIDIDYDNDGIMNCTESYGNQNINISNPNTGTISTGTYSNSFTGTIKNSLPAATIPFTGNTDGSFITEVLDGKGYYVEYNINFAKPVNLSLEYPATANATDLINANAEYIVNSDIDKTVTVLNPTNQLLIDTNYDGIYENGVTEFSSFEVRFILNGNIPLVAGTGTFKLQSYQTNSLKITHKNLLNTARNKSTFKIIATCLPIDSDNDGIVNQFDLDSDNDGILDTTEAQVNSAITIANSDSNHNGLDNAFETGLIPVDSDNDGVSDYLDSDSDNDGIYDLNESGSGALDINLNGIIDGTLTSFGTNGISNSIETTSDSGILNYTILDTDTDGIKNYRELDSDNDSCNDVIEAGFLDPNGDGLLGNITPPSINTSGIVISGSGYLTPNKNYSIAAPIVITTQPKILPVCELQNITITSLLDNGGNTYQWQLSTNGTLWNNILDNTTYSGTNAKNLIITGVTNAMNGYQYRVRLDKTGNSCGLISDKVNLTVYTLPIVKDITIIQCDDDLDAITTFNLTVKNNDISSNFTNETFTYYKTLAGANTGDVAELITTPLSFVNTLPSSMPVWARIVNTNGCFSTAQITLQVLASNIPQTFNRTFEKCDDYLNALNDDKDGISEFDFSSVTADIKALLPPGNYVITYYKNEADALSESDAIGNSLAIANIAKYRNIGYPNLQNVWVRVDNIVGNGCYGLGPFVTLKINTLPDIKTTDDNIYCLNATTPLTLDAGLQSGIVTDYKYTWSTGEITPTIQVKVGGTYTVEVENSNLCTRNRTITVVESNIATITNVTIQDLTINNSIVIFVTGPSSQYLYSLDTPVGSFQESNTFEQIAAGVHIVYVKDSNGCGTVQKEINVLEAPPFFTPNGDGIHDFWNLKGINSNYNTEGIIYIFNRFGKLIKQISPLDNGWDGTFNGIQLPADDYWFEVRLEDGKNAKGHFSLKR
jgi:trimeric autotransporter adhesin